MEYVYASLLLFRAGKKVDEASMKKVLEAAGVHPDETRVKALVAALEGVDIEKAIQEATVPVAAPVAQAAAPAAKKEEKKKEEKPSEEQAAAGLGALFG